MKSSLVLVIFILELQAFQVNAIFGILCDFQIFGGVLLDLFGVCDEDGPPPAVPDPMTPSSFPSEAPFVLDGDQGASTTPSEIPTKSPAKGSPSLSPSAFPSTTSISQAPSFSPTASPISAMPSANPSHVPSSSPSPSPSSSPSPSLSPSAFPSTSISQAPSFNPTASPTSTMPSANPSHVPSSIPSSSPRPPLNGLQNMVQTIIAAGFKTFPEALSAVDLVTPVSQTIGITVLLPVDQAFDEIQEGLVDCLSRTPEGLDVLNQILFFHVVMGVVGAVDFSTGLEVASSGGDLLVFDGKNNVNDAGIIATDIPASNGVIHVIDKVLIPDGVDLSEFLAICQAPLLL